jgi:hypothetical protein
MLRRNTTKKKARIMSKLTPRTVAALGSAILLGVATAPASAQVIGIDDGFDLARPPSLLDFASETPTLYSGASAGASYFGSRRVPSLECNDSFDFWSCREDGYSESLGDNAQSLDGSMVSAEILTSDFERTDTGGAGAKARAATDFRSLRAEAYADGGLVWQETRVNSANDGNTRTITGQSRSFANATSRWTDVFVPSADGLVIFELSLENHPGRLQVPRSVFPDNTPLPADGTASLETQVFNLDVLTQYATLSSEFEPFDGFLLVGEARDSRDDSDPPTRTFQELVINVVAGQRYSIVSQLSVEASNDADMNLFGSGRLDRILVEPGQSLSFASGAEYAISVVPVPAALPMLLGGLGLLGVVAGRRTGASTGA